MCGVCGEMRFDGAPPDVAAVGRMTDAMSARGPDAAGLHARGSVAFGHRRLTIIDLSARGSQPMIDSELGLALVFNGCIYNYRELRSELEGAGYRFFSTADSEVVLKSFHRWGAECVQHFKGMFAFAVHNTDTGAVTLARDRLGIKPLYLAEGPGRLRFASTVPALLRAGEVDTTVDRVALHHYLSFHSVVPAPHTMLRGIRKLPPATVRVIEPDGGSTEHRYWEPAFTRDPARTTWTAVDWQEALLDSLRTAVSRRMVADVPVGVLLSGGIDSSLVVALLAEQGQRDLATFSIGFDPAGGESGDEYVYSDLVARRFGTVHHKIHIDSSRLLPAVPKTVAAMSEPMVSHDCVAFYLLSEEVSKSVKVVQSGQGADEILAGYDWYPPLTEVARERSAEAYAKVFADRTHADIVALLDPRYSLDHDASGEFLAEQHAAAGAATAVDAALRLDTTVMLIEDPVKRVDTMTMAWGLEGRVPFLDHDFVELAATCPPELKLASGGKGVLKEASRKHLPAEIIDRTKGYFPVPGIRHLDGDVLTLVRDALHSRSARDRGLYRPEALDALLADPNRHRTTLGANALWQVALLEMWLQEMEQL
ncbi:N-acetylglutaminylglutamine amidotransferase [Rhodococcus aetherivorans]|uniref:N-acetylglutaminylglutamine amidotransferase n=1 Tax=Rhodococcus TaxID=1827 RepID=UPI0002D233D9|nr:N-acetylglutaminylglutamine amidotransferase [Rhodococcus aetherivorans]NCL77223.1 Asparagine synthetase [glutamine-hydrolyzing] 1 [Rhodococcus sp. YH1]UGQ43996.1 N-acetylglutaminylglutamine amidotransferase [Rhodococcus aetherivorans]WFS14184.1 N-acetylglutaminylglutamine amidotransferase [Rhodococcus aetherivorans]CCW09615.1 Asparagine synthetase [glutamine-hydrolyzing] [Rhodococcus aetherivorans]